MGRVLKHQRLDEIFIMTYDEGNSFDPIKSFESYKLLTKNITPLYIGIEVPNKENHILTIEKSIKYVEEFLYGHHKIKII